MIKIIDVDKLFERHVKAYVKDKIGKIKPEQIESQIANMYKDFGKTPLEELGGKSPEEYYLSFSAETLADALVEHIESGVEVPDYLCDALLEKDCVNVLLAKLEQDPNEEVAMYLMNIINSKGVEPCLDRYIEIVAWDYPQSMKELATEGLCEFAERVKQKLYDNWSEYSLEAKEYFAQVLSNVGEDEKALSILIEMFALHPEEVSVYASYLAKLGSDKALPVLYTAIEKEDISPITVICSRITSFSKISLIRLFSCVTVKANITLQDLLRIR